MSVKIFIISLLTLYQYIQPFSMHLSFENEAWYTKYWDKITNGKNGI